MCSIFKIRHLRAPWTPEFYEIQSFISHSNLSEIKRLNISQDKTSDCVKSSFNQRTIKDDSVGKLRRSVIPIPTFHSQQDQEIVSDKSKLLGLMMNERQLIAKHLNF